MARMRVFRVGISEKVITSNNLNGNRYLLEVAQNSPAFSDQQLIVIASRTLLVVSLLLHEVRLSLI